jgi:hypothetical protein
VESLHRLHVRDVWSNRQLDIAQSSAKPDIVLLIECNVCYIHALTCGSPVVLGVFAGKLPALKSLVSIIDTQSKGRGVRLNANTKGIPAWSFIGIEFPFSTTIQPISNDSTYQLSDHCGM